MKTKNIFTRSIFIILFAITARFALADTVGTVSGTLSVNEMGAAVYSIPFDIYPSGTGFDPQLGLAYNSQQNGYGNAGYSVCISGLSSITRAGKDLFHDNDVQKVHYEAGDNYVLDGKRLYLKQGVQGQNGSVYTVEGNPYATVTLHGNDSKTNISVWFELTDNEGNVYKYQKVLRCNLGHPMKSYSNIAWYISSAKNKNQDYINYQYTQLNNCLYLQNVTYGRAGERHTISFTYENLSSPQTFVLEGGTAGTVQKRLSSVTSYNQSDVYRQYLLTYDTTSDSSKKKYDRLSSVNVTNGSGDNLAPIVIDWAFLEQNNASHTRQNMIVRNAYFDDGVGAFGCVDVNGDGISDVIRLCNGTLQDGTGTNYTFAYVNYSSRNNNGDITYNQGQRILLPASYNWNGFTKSLNNLTCDIDGDGICDVVFPSYASNSNNNNANLIFFFLYSSRNGEMGRNSNNDFSIGLMTKGLQALYAAFDADRNGKDEIIYVEDKKYTDGYFHGKILAELERIYDEQIHIDIQLTYSQNKDIQKMFLADCNADGLQDMILVFDGGYKIYFNNGGSSLSTVFTENNSTEVTNSSTLKDYWRIEQGDFNGDGLIDFVVNEQNEAKLGFIFNNGNGTFTAGVKTFVDFSDVTDSDKDNDYFAIRVVDFDKDGLSDVFVAKTHLQSHRDLTSQYYRMDYAQVRWYVSDGTKPVLWKYDNKYGENDNCYEGYIFTGDFDGDGYAEIGSYGAPLNSATDNTSVPNTINIYSFPTDVSLGKVVSVTNGYGKETTITYANGTDPSVYTLSDSDDTVFPVNSYTLPIPLVSEVSQTNGAAGREVVSYSYRNLKAHVQGRGLLGFSSLGVRNTTLNTVTETTVENFDPVFFTPLTIRTLKTVGSDTEGQIRTNEIATSNSIEPWNGNYFSYCKSIVSTDNYNNSTRTAYEYDLSHGVPEEECTYYDGRTDFYKKKQYLSYISQQGMYVPLQTITTQKHKDDSSVYTVTNTYTYDGKGNVLHNIAVSEYDGDAVTLTTHYTRDDFGNVLSEVIRGNGVTEITRHNEYDSKKLRLLRTYTTPASYVTTYDYDVWGNVIAENDESNPNNILTTNYIYDNWGRQISSVNPDSTQTVSSTSWDNTLYNGVYKTTVTTTAKAPVTTYYDSEGREIGSSTYGVSQVAISNRTYYNGFGKPSSVHNTVGEQNIVTESIYDYQGRISTAYNADSTSTHYEYGNRSVTIEAPTGTSTQVFDAWGNIVSSTDNVSSVHYTYNSIGKPHTVTSGGSTVTMEYDGAGRRVQLTDPDAGTQTYSYAADGTLLSQTDGRGITTAYTYDNLGRQISKVCGSTTQVTTYGTSGNSLNRIEGVACDNGASEAYEYDNLGRIVSKTRSYDNNTFVIGYEYNDNGLVEKVHYPGNVTVEYNYDSYGNVTRASANDVAYFFQGPNNGLNNVTAFGNPFNGFNGFVLQDADDPRSIIPDIGQVPNPLTNYDRWAYMQIRETYCPGKSAIAYQSLNKQGAELDKINYRYDNSTGNMSRRWRTGSLSQVSGDAEDFEYDAADRLSSVTLSGYNMLFNNSYDFTYANNGNITYKTGIGQYSYQTTRPHAVASISSLENRMALDSQTTVYGDNGKISNISQGTGSSLKSMSFFYGPDDEKWKTEQTKKPSYLFIKRKAYYFDNYRYIIENANNLLNPGISEQYFLNNDVLLVKKDGDLHFYQMFRDVQGSVLSVIDENGEVVFDARYDAWGRQTVYQNDIDLRPGYCGHEMLTDFNLIDMGGRVYDPVIGRFLSCDNYVQEPDNSQNFNRYSYCLNNPLRYTDPTGEFWWLVAAATIGGVVNWASNGCEFNAKGLEHFGVGALAGAVGIGVGSGISACIAGGSFLSGAVGANCVSSTGFWAGLLSGAGAGGANGFIIGAGNSWVRGSSFESGLSDGWNGFLSGAAIGGTTGGVLGGLGAVREGRNFWTGELPKQQIPISVNDLPTGVSVVSEVQDPVTLKSIYNDTSNPHIHTEIGKLPENKVWKGMTSTQKGDYGQRMYFEKASPQNSNSLFVKEVSYRVNGTTYRADWSYIDQNETLHIVEVKSGIAPGLTQNQKIAIPVLLNGGNVNIVPFGSNANTLFKGSIPANVNKWQFDIYWYNY